jgi:hypothetical protein
MAARRWCEDGRTEIARLGEGDAYWRRAWLLQVGGDGVWG